MQHLIAEADKVLRYLVMFLPVLFALDLENEIQPLSTFFGILGWLVYWVVIEKYAARQKEIGNHH